MEELEGKVELHTRFGSGLWRTARRECGAKQLARSVAQLGDAHGQLARLDQTHPRTASAGRHKRRSVELLQSHTRALELQMLKVSTGADELELALERRLAALEALYLDAPIRAQISQNEPADPFLTVAQLIVTGFIWTMAAVCSWPFEGLGFPAFTIVILVLVALIGGSTAIEFDGRWLRVQHRLFGMRCWGSSADLTRFNAVVLTPYSVETEKGGPDWRTRLSLVSTVGSVEVGSGSQGEVEIGELTRRVREWIVIAGREAELDS